MPENTGSVRTTRVIRSVEPGETWKYCFPDAVVAR